jgi:hypothetical protein
MQAADELRIPIEQEIPLLQGDHGHRYRIPNDIWAGLGLEIRGEQNAGKLVMLEDKYQCIANHLPIFQPQGVDMDAAQLMFEGYQPETSAYKFTLRLRPQDIPNLQQNRVVTFAITAGSLGGGRFSNDMAQTSLQVYRMIRNPNWNPNNDWQTPEVSDMIMNYILNKIRVNCNGEQQPDMNPDQDIEMQAGRKKSRRQKSRRQKKKLATRRKKTYLHTRRR